MTSVLEPHLIFSDLLTEVNLKPWWEKLRGYCFAAGVISALFMTYIMLSSVPVDCFPFNAENVTTEFSAPRAKFISNYCSSQLPFYISYAGLVSLCMSVVIIIASSYWTLLPEVVNSFLTFAQFEKIITELDSTADQICALSSQVLNAGPVLDSTANQIHALSSQILNAVPVLDSTADQNFAFEKIWNAGPVLISNANQICALSSQISNADPRKDSQQDQERRKVRKACSLLWKYESQNYVGDIYLNRNIILLISTIISTLISTTLVVLLFVDDSDFKCFFDLKLELTGCEIEPEYYFCSFSTAKKLQPLMVTFTLSLLAQIVFIIPGFMKVNAFENTEKALSEKGNAAASYCCFMMNFWKYSRPTSCGALEQVVEHIFQDAVYGMKNNLEDAIKDDLELVDIYSCMAQTAQKDIFVTITRMVGQNEFISGDTPHENVIGCTRGLKPKVKFADFYNFIQYLNQVKYWEMLATIFVTNASDWFEKLPSNTDNLEVIESNLDQISSRTRKSFLFFVEKELCSTPGYDFVMKLVDPTKTYIHSNEVGTRTSTVYCARRDSSHRDSVSVAKKLHDANLLKIGNFSSEAHERILSDHRHELDLYISVNKYDHYMYNIACLISLYKFDNWGENTNKMAQYFNDNKEWELLVALINAYTIEDPDDISLLDIGCPVTNFNVSKESVEKEQNLFNRPSILYYALRRPDYTKFQYTALRHILHHSKNTREKMVRYEEKTENAYMYLEHLQHNIRLKAIIRKMLDTSQVPNNGQAHGPNQVQNEDNGPVQGANRAQNEGNGPVQGPNRAQNEGNGQAQGPNRAQNEGNGQAQGPNRAQNEGNRPVQGPNRAQNEGNGQAQGLNRAQNEGDGQAQDLNRAQNEGDEIAQGPNQVQNEGDGLAQGSNQVQNEGDGAAQGPDQDYIIMMVDENEPLLTDG